MNIARVMILLLMVLCASCSQQTNSMRTATEMESLAKKHYQDYLFDYGLDSARFVNVPLRVTSNGTHLYRWVANTIAGDTVGIEIEILASKKEMPVLSIAGKKESWYTFLEENRIAKQNKDKK